MIETDRLLLLPPKADDLAWLLAAMNTPAVLRYLGGTVKSADAVAEGLEADISAFANGGHRRWTVWLRDDGVRIGRCGLFHIRSPAAPAELHGASEVGWTFAEPWWGQGYATEAARAVIDFYFNTAGQDCLWSQTSESNAASTRVMQRLGFSRCAALDYVDPDYPETDNPTTVYQMGRAQWAARG